MILAWCQAKRLLIYCEPKRGRERESMSVVFSSFLSDGRMSFLDFLLWPKAMSKMRFNKICVNYNDLTAALLDHG